MVTLGFDGYASAERRRATLDVNRTLDPLVDGAAFRLSALWQDSGVAGRDYAEKKTVAWLPHWLWDWAPPLGSRSASSTTNRTTARILARSVASSVARPPPCGRFTRSIAAGGTATSRTSTG